MHRPIEKTITYDGEGEPILEFTEQECELLGMEIGDTIVWNISETGEVSFRVEKDGEEEEDKYVEHLIR